MPLVNPRGDAQKLAQELGLEAQNLHDTRPGDWWVTFASRWNSYRQRIEALPRLPDDVRDDLRIAVDDVTRAYDTYIRSPVERGHVVKDGDKIRARLETLFGHLARLPGRHDWPLAPQIPPVSIFTGDPRMAELELLRSLEKDGRRKFNFEKRDGGPYFGLPTQAFRELIVDFLVRGLLNGPATRPDGPVPSAEIETLYRNAQEISKVMEGKEVELRLNHAGRVYLWNLRDSLLLARDREDFGILWNKRAWQRALPLQLLWATLQHPVSILFLDLDHFKRVNDNYNHLKGDKVLQATFTLIRDSIFGIGEAYRYGGEELGVILPGVALEQARQTAEIIRATIEKEVAKLAELKECQTISIGLAVFTSSVPPDEAIGFVDSLLYKAKNAGRNRVEEAIWQNADTASGEGH